jgi:hypothetical protein
VLAAASLVFVGRFEFAARGIDTMPGHAPQYGDARCVISIRRTPAPTVRIGMRLPHTFSMLSALALTLFAGAAPGAPALAVMTYRGPCDASAAVALDTDHFVVAGDEDNTLRVYRRGRPEPVGEAPLAAFLDSGNKESDLEAAAAVGKRIYWIASHGRNSKGKLRPDRHRFFATDIDPGAQPGVTPAGTPYRGLLDDLAAAPTLAGLRLGDAAQLAPEAPGGLNIEGLAAMPDGSLLLGLRNPVPNGRALLVPLLNPAEIVTAGSGRKARFGEPILLELRGRGVRSIDRALDGRGYWIVAGPTADAGAFSLYRWSGQTKDAPRIVDSRELVGLRPEALFELPGGDGTLQILSDDGGVETKGTACKDRPMTAQGFRSITLRP